MIWDVICRRDVRTEKVEGEDLHPLWYGVGRVITFREMSRCKFVLSKKTIKKYKIYLEFSKIIWVHIAQRVLKSRGSREFLCKLNKLNEISGWRGAVEQGGDWALYMLPKIALRNFFSRPPSIKYDDLRCIQKVKSLLYYHLFHKKVLHICIQMKFHFLFLTG